MTKEDRTVLEGYRDAFNGCLDTENPYPLEPERSWWRDGWHCHRPVRTSAPEPVSLSGPANDNRFALLVGGRP